MSWTGAEGFMVKMKILFYLTVFTREGKERRLLELMRFLRVHDAADMELARMRAR